jgi:nucleotidyltransferase substrate binding protein (TIGR01987 family)
MKVLGSATAAAKPAVREMARNNLILDAELWLKFIEARNNSSHSYDEEVAKKVFIEIELFFPEVNKLLTVLEKTK